MEWLSLGLLANIAAGVVFLVYWIVVFAMLYHLSRFGIGTQPKKFAAFLLFGSLAISFAAVILYAQTDLEAFLDIVEQHAQ